MIPEEKPRFVRFDRFVVDTGRRLLLRDSEPVALNSKTFDLLVALLEQRGELVTKDALLSRVWPNQAVEEGNLTVHVSALRKALGERRGEHRYVVTVPGRGYSFVAETEDWAPASALRATVGRPARGARVKAFALGAVILASAAAIAYWRHIHPTSDSPAPVMSTRLLTTVGNVSGATLSPDGTRFAYFQYTDAQYTLWVGRTDSGQAVQVESLDGASESLVFSKDGNRIFYILHDALYELALPGGHPRKLLDGVGAGFGLSPDNGSVAFVRQGSAPSSIVVAALDGSGREHQVAALPQGRFFSSYGPGWSSDGSTLAIGATSESSPGHAALMSVNVSDGAVTPIGAELWDSIGRVAWLADGSGVVFHAIGASSDYHIWLMDIAHGRLRCITPDLSRYGRASVSVSDDGRSLVAVRGEINSAIWVAPADGPGPARAVTSSAFGKLDGSAGLAWTPDGRILYSSFVNNSYSLWSMSADGTNARPLTSSGFIDRFPQATVDGRSIVFESNRGGGNDIWRMDADGGHLRPLTTGGNAEHPSLTPDGQWIFYTSSSGGTSAIWKTSVDGGAAQPIAGPGNWPSVSPDGKLLAFEVPADPGTPKLAVISLADGRRIGEYPQPPGGRFTNGLHWSADASAILFRDFTRGLWRQPIAGGPPRKLPDVPDRRIYCFDWSADRRLLAMAYGDEVRDAVLMAPFR